MRRNFSSIIEMRWKWKTMSQLPIMRMMFKIFCAQQRVNTKKLRTSIWLHSFQLSSKKGVIYQNKMNVNFRRKKNIKNKSIKFSIIRNKSNLSSTTQMCNTCHDLSWLTHWMIEWVTSCHWHVTIVSL